MFIKAIVTARALTLVPAASFAFSSSSRGNQAQSCGLGTARANAQLSCIKLTTG